MKKAMINYIQNSKNDELYTPEYAIEPLLKYLKPHSTILSPFDKWESHFVQILTKAGHNVYFSNINEPHIHSVFNEEDLYNDCLLKSNFFNYTKEDIKQMKIDYIISKPPFSLKDEVLDKLYKLNTPFAMLLPITTLESVFRNKLFTIYGIELLIFDKRINFLKENKSNWFNTSYFCWKILPKKIIFTELKKA